jgi:hypothetical protein
MTDRAQDTKRHTLELPAHMMELIDILWRSDPRYTSRNHYINMVLRGHLEKVEELRRANV